MAATRGDERTDVPVSVAELCRRLGAAVPADSPTTGATPVLVGDILRREGRPPVPVEAPAQVPGPAPEPGANRPAIPVPRRRGEACKTALGAGGLVVAGSVLGAALLAAAGVGGPLPFGNQLGDEAEQFQGEGTLVQPGTAYGSARGHHVVAGADLLRSIAYFTPWTDDAPASPSIPTARPATAPTGSTTIAAALPVATPPQNGVVAAPPAVVAPGETAPEAAPTAPQGVVEGVAPGVPQAVGDVVDGVTTTIIPAVDDTVGTVAPVVGSITDDLAPVVAPVATVVTPVTAVVAPAVTGVTDVLEPVTEVAGPVLAPVVTPVAQIAAPLVGPTLEATAPLLDALTPVSEPVLDAAGPVVAPVLAVVEPTVAPVLDAVQPGLDAAAPFLEPLGPVVTRVGTAADDLTVPEPADLPGAAQQVVQGATGTALPGAVATATALVESAPVTELVQETTGAVGPSPSADADAVSPVEEIAGAVTDTAPPALRVAELPTVALPVVGSATSAEPAAEAEPFTAPLRVVPEVDPIDSPTMPLRIVAPQPAETDAPADEARSVETADAEEDAAPETTRLPVVDNVTVAGGFLGR